jgi:hypothetical protein
VLARPKEAKATKTAAKPAPKGKKAAAETSSEVVPGEIIARTSGQVSIDKGKVSILFEERESRDYAIPAAARLRVHDGDYIHAGQALTEGPLNPQDILRIQGPEAVQMYLVEEVQKVYRSQGVTINDKHIETIVRQMLRRVRVDSPGDTKMLPGELVDRFKFESENASVLAEGGEPATAQPVLLGVTKASLNTESFLAAASFQETTRVLTEAAISGQVDRLLGLKENVIIGKLIPARATIDLPPPPVRVQELPPGMMEGGEAGLRPAWLAGGDEDELDEPFDEEGLAGDIREVIEGELDEVGLDEDELADAGLDIEGEEADVSGDDLADIIDEALETEE